MQPRLFDSSQTETAKRLQESAQTLIDSMQGTDLWTPDRAFTASMLQLVVQRIADVPGSAVSGLVKEAGTWFDKLMTGAAVGDAGIIEELDGLPQQ